MMAESSGNDEATLEHTPTWAVAVVCFILITVSILIEHVLHLLAKVSHAFLDLLLLGKVY